MPTISQLPTATSISAADEIPISQDGLVRAVSVSTLLAATQPAILIDTSALLGRTSLGAGAPEKVDVGCGISLSNGTLTADGLDHATFSRTSDLAIEADLVVSNRGTPMLMEASLLRGLFSAGQNISIDSGGIISTINADAATSASNTQSLPVTTSIDPQDMIAVSRSGSNRAISYQNLLGGVTIDQVAVAGPVSDADLIWVGQGSNVMTSQNFGAIWNWITRKLPTYRCPTVEVTVNTTLDTTVHCGRLLICSQPITLSPLLTNMGSGFQCTIMNVSSGDVTLGSGFISSSGRLSLSPWQSATVSCVTYSSGTIAFVALPSTTSAIVIPGQAGGLTGSIVASTAITLSWQDPSSGGPVSIYNLLYRPTGSAAWSASLSLTHVTTYQVTGLLPATSYDFIVTAQNAAGVGPISTVCTVSTANGGQPTVPGQLSGFTARPTSNSTVDLAWLAQTGAMAATSYTIQYRTTGTTGWTSAVSGVVATGITVSGLQSGTSYDFSIFGVNVAGSGLLSAILTASTQTVSQPSVSISWNVWPTGNYNRGTGSIGVNAHVLPATSAIQFGFSMSASVPPSNWTAATPVNADLWGAYVPTPATAGTWYAWAESTDGNGSKVATTTFVVQ